MADVARLAGVSGQTVSRVANEVENVDPATRARVLAAMREVGYRPNRAARALRSGRFGSIGVIMFSLSSYGNTRSLEAIATGAASAGYSITLIPLASASPMAVAAAFARLSEHAVDGVVIIMEAHYLHDSQVELPTDLPIVVLDSSGQYPYPIIDTDQAQGARLATQHLLDLGHDTVWHVSGPAVSFSATRRRDSWRATLEAAGARVPEVLRGDWSANSGYDAGCILAERDDVTAVFASNDEMALGVLRAFREHGIRVPEDRSVVGFDDMRESANFSPPLTTIHQNFERVGIRALEALVHEIETGDTSERIIVPTQLVQRASTAPPPARPGRVARP
ncbi:LacI family DNA-binding transcriptional regulator [Microbacterium sediminicola]|uniref:LacI family DNA-binding transcriptional regulator n=1 Tax=Microbacterium sediminicola TaxID=415210 RepID=A0ABN2I960_9MICO